MKNAGPLKKSAAPVKKAAAPAKKTAPAKAAPQVTIALKQFAAQPEVAVLADLMTRTAE